MKTYKKYLGLMLPLALAFGMGACQDDFDAPNPDSFDEVATLQANTSILDLKTMYWNDNTDLTDYVNEVGTYTQDMLNKLSEDSKTNKAIGDHVIIKGRVASSDYTGNIYKTLILQDETAAITIGIDATSLYAKYPMGQEVVIDVTGLYIGKYRGLMQLGIAQESGVNRMPLQFFMQHAERNGSAYVTDSKGNTRMNPVDTALVTISEVNSYIGSPETTRQWQSRLVRFNNVAFQGGGELTYAEKETTAQRYIQDAYGNAIMVYNSGYSDFWSETLPAGNGDVVGILSYYQSSGWQVLLIDTEGCLNFGNPTLEPGSRERPYTVEEVIGFENGDVNVRGWITGYIVGAVAGGFNTDNPITGNDDIEWGAPSSLKNSLVIAPSPDVKDISKCLAFELPQGTVLREYANLVDHPENLNRQMWILGNAAKYLGTYGVTGVTGTADDFAIDGVELPTTPSTDGDGSEAKPYTVAQVKAMNPTSTSVAVKEGVWVNGYIVGWANMSTTYYINESTATFTVPATMNTNILVAATPTVKDYTECIGIQLPSGDVRTALNLKDNPGNLGKAVKLKGDVMKYSGVAGLKNTSEYRLDGTGTPDTPSGQLFAESFKSSMGKFFIHNVSMSPDLTYVWQHDATYGYMKASAYIGGSKASDSWLVSPIFDLTAAQSPSFSFDHVVNKFPSLDVAKQQVSVCVSVDGGNWQRLTIANWTDNASWKPFANSGDIDLSAYAGKKVQIGFHYTSTDAASGTWEVNNFVISGSGSVTVTETTTVPGGDGGSGSGGETTDPDPEKPDQPEVPSGAHQADLNTFNGGVPKSSYGSLSSTSGWTAENAALQCGSDGAADNNPKFKFLGASSTFAVCLNGNTGKVGKLTSPSLTGGISKLAFNYGYAFGDTKCKFTVNIKQGGNVVKSETFDGELTKFEVNTFTWEKIGVSGDFVIEIVNDCPSAAASNKDRLSIWNLVWDN